MTGYLPTLPNFKWATLSQDPVSLHEQDAPLSSLPPGQRLALDQLILESQPVFSTLSNQLPPHDVWRNAATTETTLRDQILIRLLRFNNFSIQSSLRQLRATLLWRGREKVSMKATSIMHGREAGIPLVLLDCEDLEKQGERLFLAVAECYVKKEVVHRVQEVGVSRMFDYMMYDVNGPRVSRGVVLVDFTGFSVRNVDLVGLRSGVMTYMAHYPDIFYKIFLINYPSFLYGVWRVIKGFLDERTASRVIWVKDREEVLGHLETSFSKEKLPAWLGGGQPNEVMTLLNGSQVDPAVLEGRFS